MKTMFDNMNYRLMDDNGGDGGDLGTIANPGDGGDATPTEFNATSVADFNEEQLGGLNLTQEQQNAFVNNQDVQLTDEQRTSFDKLIADNAGPGNGNAAPETYADYTLPKGMEIDTEMVTDMNAEFKALGLTQDQAQGLVDKYSGLMTARETAASTNYEKGVVEWEGQVKADKDLGGDNFNETKRLSVTAVAKLGTPELGKFLNEYGIGSHPEIVRLLVNAGKLVDEDGPGGGGPSGNDPTRQDILYPESA